ncbi:MAG: MBOAT family protein [Desulfobacterales bacterium]|uniref:MBOAT family protein n=1 Tax=Candidatus Desulfatibia vada TaxID=2841696 RepID=A0A8J6TT52_9BACT|nr:MBOAT family protein [Candidatus Desulfatibia vada]
MSFNSFQFLIFFPSVVGLYFLIPYRFRWILLLAASYYFYMCWKVEYIFLIIASTMIDYFTGIMMGREEDKRKRKKYLIISLSGNLGLLFAFKYFNFFNDSFRTVFNEFNIFYNVSAFNVLLPVGISFYTFQTLSYAIDVYQGRKEPERHLGIFALYVSFFPQLVAGPIERSTRLLPQFYKKHDFDYRRVTFGLQLMLWGFFKKVVIADRLAVVVNQVYNNPTDYTGITLIIATYFFAFQIYCDFSGYSDIAIGAAQVLGYDLMKNFNRPYFSKSIGEFWRRWHISLSTWFRDYLYFPLGGNRVSTARWYYNIMVVFIISGLWHGANWTFIIWGSLHGIYYLCSLWLKHFGVKLSNLFNLNRYPLIQKFIKVFITFHLVTFAWIFFRSNSVSDAFYIVTHLFDNLGYFILHINALGSGKELIGGDLGLGKLELIVSAMLIISMEITHLIQRKRSIRELIAEKAIWIRWPAYYTIIFGTLLLGKYGVQDFIYFQF